MPPFQREEAKLTDCIRFVPITTTSCPENTDENEAQAGKALKGCPSRTPSARTGVKASYLMLHPAPRECPHLNWTLKNEQYEVVRKARFKLGFDERFLSEGGVVPYRVVFSPRLALPNKV
jgi:hypothetical protein